MKRLIVISAFVAAASGAWAQKECVKTAVNLTGSQKVLTTSGAKSTTFQPTYVYYERKRLRKKDQAYSVPGVSADKFASEPLMLNSKRDVTAVPEQYNVSVGLPDRNVAACPDSVVNLAAMVNVERVNSYTGNRPGTKTEPTYVRVTKRQYKMAERKKRKIERKQEKIARRADVSVETRSTASLK